MTDTTTTDTTATADTSTTATTATTDSTTATASTAGEVPGDASTTSTTADATATQEEGAPESYADFTLPENYVMDDERKAALIEYGKANNLSQAKAQALVDKHIEMMESGRAAERNARVTAWTAQSQAEFGDKFEAIATDARAGVAHMAKTRPNVLKTFDDEAWGSHPDALAAFAEIGRLTRGSAMEGLGNDTATSGSGRSAASVLYDHPTSKPA
jgi:hypothetical protein